ncbi:hypothetical protein H4V97_002629 [Flavobacterium sp. CG_23.5]|uniref:GEVED domain-containing protein n=1 Tax=Flavobacterium sp. CG_23.5 TaxID=2760708 RepID=UPI001AE1727D|nr:GEVED domain-containing protein [Flavobacterium sp. CG_23.5]MBP2284311.1 hypothetical protein [Flavobacterium sp. CG_23.5]
MIENYYYKNKICKFFITNYSQICSKTTAKTTKNKTQTIIAFLSLFFLFFLGNEMNGQTTLYTTGFESGQTGVIGTANNSASFGTVSSGGNIAPYCGQITAEGAPSKAYDGSIITNTTLSFITGKYYVVTVFAKVASASGKLRIMKSLTATNTAMKNATGSDIILNASSENVTSSSWVKYTAGFTVAANETKYIGFQMFQSGTPGAQMLLDDISIVEYDSVQPESYCTPAGNLNCTLNDFISNVTFNTLNTTSTCGAGGYTNYAAAGTQTTTVLRGSSYNFNLSVGNGSGTHGAGVWIDFNQNGSFSDSGEFFLVSNTINPSTTKTISIPIPAGATTGITRMRVRYAYNTTVASGSGMSCTMPGTYGETEDYTISIANTTCSAPAQATVFVLGTKTSTSLPFTFTASSPAASSYLIVRSLTSTPPSQPVNGTIYTTANVASLGAAFSFVQSAATTSIPETGLSSGTTYYYFIFAYNDTSCAGGPVYKTGGALTGTGTTLTGYCIPAPSSVDASGITNVSFSTVNNTTAAETTNYGDYTAMIGTGIKGTSVPINITTSTLSYAYQLIIWVDWNDDLDFNDTGENVYSGSVTSATLAATIAIPSGATIGNHRIRIGAIDLGTPTPCYTGTYGTYEDYTLNVTAAVACTLAPTVTTPPNKSIASGTSTTFTSTIANSPDSIIWEVSTDGGTNYSIITNGGVYSGATTATLTISAAPSSMTGFKYKVKATNACGNATSTPGNLTVTQTYCAPSSTTSTTYIDGLATTGTLQDLVSSSSAGYNASGYDDNSSIILGRQIPGGAINLNIDVTGPQVSFISVFIDWNSDGDFLDAGEKVYTTGITATNDTSFGFIVPTSQSPGNYRMRVRTRSYGDSSTILACDTGYSTGEAEDFTISIVSDCASKISLVTGGTNCGTGTVNLGAASDGGATEFRWYSAKTGGSLLGTTATGSWTTPSISATTTYYVSSYNGSCESLVRVAVKAIIYPIANIAFSPALPTICGSGTILTIGASGDSAIEDLFTENFEGGTLGNFTLNTISNINTKGNTPLAEVWNVKTSSYLPINTNVFKPAINSGGAGTSENKFAFTTSDTADGTTVNTAIQSFVINTNGFTNLTLTFDHYYADYGTSDKIDIEVSTDGGTTWSTTPVITYTADDGSAGNFATKTVDFTSFINQANLKFRFRYSAGWDEGYALDNVKLFGTKPLTSTFVWGGTNVADLYSDLNATIPYDGKTPLATVYAKPNVTTGTQWDFTAQTTLPNGCVINKTITVPNNTKTWNGSVNSNYNQPNNWYPPGKPTASNCVEVSNVTPNPITSDLAYAYNLTLTNAASVLNITSGNTIIVIDKVTVTAGGSFNIANNASLIQTNNVANTGIANIQRITQPMSKLDYTYWSTPVTLASNFTLGLLSPNSPLMFSWIPTISNGPGNWQSETSITKMDPRKGYIVRAPNTFSSTIKTSYTATFVGTPNNGDITTPIQKGTLSGTIGLNDEDDEWNLIGNPYPSAINAAAFLNLASNVPVIDGTLYLWTHNAQPSTVYADPFYGDYVLNYTENDYAVFNTTGGTATAAASTGGSVPSGYIASGQSFFVKAANSMTNGTTLNATFNNSMRVGTEGKNGDFFKLTNNQKNEAIPKSVPEIERHRIWLNLTNNSGAFSQTLLGYVAGATQGLDRSFDGESLGGNDVSFYSIIPEAQLTIQGRGLPFDENDHIPLGYNSEISGELSIRIDHIDGLFDTQNIYLEDKVQNVIHDLKEAPYVFKTEIGGFDERFVLLFTNKTLGTDTFNLATANEVNVIVNQNVTVQSSNQLIKNIVVYDLLGRKIDSYKKVSALKYTLNHLTKMTAGLIVKITLEDDTVLSKKIIY